MEYVLNIIMNDERSSLITKQIEISSTKKELPNILCQITDVGFFDESDMIYYSPNRIFEIKVDKWKTK